MLPKQVISVAKTFVGTPFYKDGRIKGKALDCIGLIVCICKELGWDGPSCCEYRLMPSEEALEKAVAEFKLVKLQELVPGAMLCLRLGSALRPQNHFAILTAENTIIHSHDRIGRVVEHGFASSWKDRVHSVWALPLVRYE